MISVQTAYTPNRLYSFPGELWTYRRQISLHDCPHLLTPEKLRERENLEKKYGKNNPFVQSMLYGQFQIAGEGNYIFETSHIEKLKEAMRPAGASPIKGDIRAAGDVSGSRKDKQVLMVRYGTEILLVDEHAEENEILQAEYWVKTLRGLSIEPHQFTIDGGGIGASVANYMETRLGYSGINRFMANVKPTYSEEFADRYTELHWWIKELLNFEVLVFPGFYADLIKDFRLRQYVELEKDKIKAQPKTQHRKDNSGHSPDFLDTLVFLLNDFPMDQIRRGMYEKRRKEGGGGYWDKRKTTEVSPIEQEAERASGGGGIFPALRKLPSIQDIATKARKLR